MTPPTVTSPTTVKVVFIFVPPDTLKPFAKAVGVTPFIDLFFNASDPVRVATAIPLTNKLESTIIFAFAKSVSVIVVFPFTNKEESILVFNLSAFKFILSDNDIVSDFNISPMSFKVAIVPEVGKITLLLAVVVIVKSPTPFVIILLPKVIVLPLLSTPVPPLDPGKIELIVNEESENLEFNAVKA